MSWLQTFEKFGLTALGAILPIPGGTAIGTALASLIGAPDSKPESIATVLENSADAVTKALAFQVQNQAAILQIQVNAEIENRKQDSADMATVNQTIQTEAKSEHWIQWVWRPLSGLLFAPTILLYYVVLPACKIQLPPVDPTVWVMWGSVLGITAWHRGVGQNLQIKQNGN